MPAEGRQEVKHGQQHSTSNSPNPGSKHTCPPTQPRRRFKEIKPASSQWHPRVKLGHHRHHAVVPRLAALM